MGADFRTAFPTFWAWKLNRKLIEENKSVTDWLGGEKLGLTQGLCETGSVILKPPPICLGKDPKTLPLQVDISQPIDNEQVFQNRTWQYGPVLHFVTFPLYFLPSYETAIRIWHLLCCVFFLVSLVLWCRLLFLETQLHSFFVLSLYLGLWLNFSPLYRALQGTEIEVFELMMLSFCFYFLSREKDNLAGISLAIAGFAKFLPLGFLPYFFIRKKYRLVASALVTTTLIVILTQWTLGWEWSFTRRLVNSFDSGMLAGGSQSISSWIYRLFADFDLWKDSTDTINFPPVAHPERAALVTRYVLVSLALFYSALFVFSKSKAISLLEIGICGTMCIIFAF